MRLHRGVRLHLGSGSYVDTRETYTVLDSPGTLRVLVAPESRPGAPFLADVPRVRTVTTTCPTCGGDSRHKLGCTLPVWEHAYVEPAIVQASRPGTCRVCDRDRVDRLHGPGRCVHCGQELYRGRPGSVGRYALTTNAAGTDLYGSGSECPANGAGHEARPELAAAARG